MIIRHIAKARPRAKSLTRTMVRMRVRSEHSDRTGRNGRMGTVLAKHASLEVRGWPEWREASHSLGRTAKDAEEQFASGLSEEDAQAQEMNVYKPSKKVSSWPQMVARLTKERDEVVAENKKLEEENMELKRRCCDLWRQVMEAQARNDS